MSLNGSLETFALSDVLTLLSSTAKTGELRVTGRRLEGRLWLSGGDLVASEAGRSTGHVDALFELLRMEDGSFTFSDAAPTREGERTPVTPVLAEATARLGEWREIAEVVPSLAVGIRLARTLPEDEIIVTAARWAALVAVAEGHVVGDVADCLGLGEFEGCRLIKDLSDDGLVDVLGEVAVAPPPPPPPAPVVEPAPAVVEDGDELDEDELEDDELDPVDGLEEDDDEVVEDDDADVEEPDPLAALTEAAARLAAMAPPEPGVEDTEAAAVVAGLPANAQALLENHGLNPDELDGDEPINRGLLLKFLSSVRS